MMQTYAGNNTSIRNIFLMDNGIGKRIRELRGTMTMKTFSAPLGVSTTAISNVENGHTELSMSLAVKISESYGVSLDWIVKGSGVQSVGEPIAPYGKDSNAIIIDKDELIELQRLAMKNLKAEQQQQEAKTESLKNS